MSRRTLARAAVLAALLGAAAVAAVASYGALAGRPHRPQRWLEAIALARRADRTKGVVPALRTRDEAVADFEALARSGPAPERSKAMVLAALLQLRNALDQPTQSRTLLAGAAATLQSAVRLDRANEDAAFDLELLLTQAARSGQPISPRAPSRNSRASKHGRSSVAPGGGGY